jgi:NAD+ kinase
MLNAAIHPVEKTQPTRSTGVSPFRTIALIGRYDASGLAAPLATMGDYLRKQGREVLVEKDTASSSRIAGFPVADYAEIGARADLAVVQGGDGSMLGAARNLAPHRVPLVGVNQGRLGFMADIASATMLEAMADILAGRYATEERSMLAVEVRRGGRTEFSTLVLNDVVVNKGAVLRLIEILVSIGGESMYHLRADGLIIATPTGSTAYSLSSDGPILQPSLPAIALVPICPHTLSNRPIVVSDRSAIEVTLRRAVDARLHLDGQLERRLMEGDRVAISRAAHSVSFVHPPGYNYYAMLRGKLHWSEGL